MEPVTGIITAFIVGGGVQAIFNWLITNKKTTSDQAAALITALTARVDTVEKHAADCEQKHQECMEKTVNMAQQIGEMKGRLDEVSSLSTKTALAVQNQ